MRLFGQQVFDDAISGTGKTWYSPARYDELLGRADMLAIMAVVTGLTGTTPSLTLAAEHSANGRNWHEIDTLTVGLSNDAAYYGTVPLWPRLLARVRLRATLTGTDPSCRLKLYVTGRSF
jgi:uncharacterized ParB-like nuclease family protein